MRCGIKAKGREAAVDFSLWNQEQFLTPLLFILHVEGSSCLGQQFPLKITRRGLGRKKNSKKNQCDLQASHCGGKTDPPTPNPQPPAPTPCIPVKTFK